MNERARILGTIAFAIGVLFILLPALTGGFVFTDVFWGMVGGYGLGAGTVMWIHIRLEDHERSGEREILSK